MKTHFDRLCLCCFTPLLLDVSFGYLAIAADPVSRPANWFVFRLQAAEYM